MSRQLSPSELIVNPDGSIYHINLHPKDLGDYIITVGDPGRVPMVSRYFDEIETKKEKREFVTHVGRVGDKRLTVISSGIGPDNIDIVINELDALANIDLENRTVREDLRSLNILRLGTSGCLQADIPVDNILFSGFGMGMDNLLHFYQHSSNPAEARLRADFSYFMNEHDIKIPVEPYFAQGSTELLAGLNRNDYTGITITAPGFYAPQGRQLRARSKMEPQLLEKLAQFHSDDWVITNFEMETSAIYGLSRILGHQALSCNLILANRAANTFSPAPKKAMDQMIQTLLERISELP